MEVASCKSDHYSYYDLARENGFARDLVIAFGDLLRRCDIYIDR